MGKLSNAAWLASTLISVGGFAAQPGSLDSAYGDQGVAVFGFDLAPSVLATDRFHLVLRDGGLLFADAPERRLTVAKLRANGSVETSFGNQGVCAIRDTPVWAESGIHAQELADGRILVGSNIYDGTNSYLLARWNADGTQDATFRGTGHLKMLGRYHISLTDGRILVLNFGSSLRITRLLNDGSVDASYGTSGTLTLPVAALFGLSNQTPRSQILPDGKVLVACLRGSGLQQLFRLNSDGTLDSSFGTQGFMALSTPSSSYVDTFLALPSGVILIANGGQLKRYSALGAFLDSPVAATVTEINGLNADGRVLVTIRTSNQGTYHRLVDTTAWTLAELPWLVGQTFSSNARPLAAGGFLVHQFVDFNRPRSLVRHLPDGTLDLSFGQAGKLDPQWYPPGDCSRVRLQEAGDGGMSVLFDQGKDSTRSIYGGYSLLRAGKRAFVRVSATGQPVAPITLGDRSSYVVANLGRDGSCLLAESGIVKRIQADGTRTTAHSVTRLPFTLSSLIDTWDGGLVLGGYEPANRGNGVGSGSLRSLGDDKALLSLCSARGALKTLRPVYLRGHVMDICHDGLGGWHFASHDYDYFLLRVHEGHDYGHFFANGRWDLLSYGAGVNSRLSAGERVPVFPRPGAVPSVRVFGEFIGDQWKRTPAKITTSSYTLELPEFTGNIAATADADGSVVVAGPVQQGYALRRITPAGTMDPGFGGEVLSQDGEEDVISDVFRSKTGVWWVAGGTKDVATYRLFLAKHTPQPFVATLLEPDRPLVLNRRTGLLEHSVLVTNHSGKTEDLILRISDMPPIVRSVYGAPEQVLAGTSGKKAWTVPVADLPAGQSRTVTLGYYALTRQPLVFTPVLEVLASEEKKP